MVTERVEVVPRPAGMFRLDVSDPSIRDISFISRDELDSAIAEIVSLIHQRHVRDWQPIRIELAAPEHLHREWDVEAIPVRSTVLGDLDCLVLARVPLESGSAMSVDAIIGNGLDAPLSRRFVGGERGAGVIGIVCHGAQIDDLVDDLLGRPRPSVAVLAACEAHDRIDWGRFRWWAKDLIVVDGPVDIAFADALVATVLDRLSAGDSIEDALIRAKGHVDGLDTSFSAAVRYYSASNHGRQVEHPFTTPDLSTTAIEFVDGTGRLDEVLERLAAGETVLVVGDHGSGKTAFLVETAKRLRVDGRRVFTWFPTPSHRESHSRSALESRIVREDPAVIVVDDVDETADGAEGLLDAVDGIGSGRGLLLAGSHGLLDDDRLADATVVDLAASTTVRQLVERLRPEHSSVDEIVAVAESDVELALALLTGGSEGDPPKDYLDKLSREISRLSRLAGIDRPTFLRVAEVVGLIEAPGIEIDDVAMIAGVEVAEAGKALDALRMLRSEVRVRRSRWWTSSPGAARVTFRLDRSLPEHAVHASIAEYFGRPILDSAHDPDPYAIAHALRHALAGLDLSSGWDVEGRRRLELAHGLLALPSFRRSRVAADPEGFAAELEALAEIDERLETGRSSNQP